MSKFVTAVSLLINNRNMFFSQLIQYFNFVFSDEMYLKCLFKYRMNKSLDLDNPKTFNEKLQWLKLNDRNPLYTNLVDKYKVKEYVTEIIGKKYVPSLYGLWENPEEIDYDSLPDSFVLKTTHGGGNEGVIIVKDKRTIDPEKIKKKLVRALKQDLYKVSREWPYKNVKKRIIAEEYLEDAATNELRDYKFFCFDGVVKALFVATERQKRQEPYFNFFDSEYNNLDIQQGHPKSKSLPLKPAKFDEMKSIAEKLSKGIPHVRVDLYEANGKIYFGELTFYHFGGMVPFHPEKWDVEFGAWLNLPKKK